MNIEKKMKKNANFLFFCIISLDIVDVAIKYISFIL